MNFSFGILKPDCIERKLTSEVFHEIENSGFKVIAKSLDYFVPEFVSVVYKGSIGKDYYNDLVDFLISGPIIAYVVYSKYIDTIDAFNKLIGHKDPLIAGPDTIRGKFGESIRRNISHSTCNEETFNNEVRLFFSENQLTGLKII